MSDSRGRGSAGASASSWWRRLSLGLLAGGAVLLVVAVPASILAWVNLVEEAPSAAASSPPSSLGSASPVPSGWRVESWHNVTLLVPDTWGYGPISRCPTGSAPKVQRPGPVLLPKTCPSSDGWRLGVAFLPKGSDPQVRPAKKAYAVQIVPLTSATVVVVTRGKTLATRIANSVRIFDGSDPNGCPAKIDLPVLGSMTATSSPLSSAGGALCRYGIKVRSAVISGDLIQSERLTAEQSQQAVAALEAAPVGNGPKPKSCHSFAEPEAALMVFGTDRVWVHYSGCQSHGIDGVGPSSRKLTADVLRWAVPVKWLVPLDSQIKALRG